ncbi:Fyv6p KNAG_0H03600 [Huiozyma naganishii CBS 8797]|uniref:FAM192A/Fyv6 N-terminal domain-containing protein n=1 Tax=Huiozyma naganishii (strain ATCC MYA-139 / BCRC 22969 / CBS 8797 / KCTC 17520 / NBRC 10181 / NCYC 3082 / Yp74L-3) TaxID=1071383 RepID=J7S8W1_HUIN7|nr:hypothetical protein KNAG_0H03600 [Kazachstania naganishii CBS 8797]CCK71774.1 hypothetical protein KNAG_0H03600 [Kazachstania naganishii CBS 8797]
MVDKSTPRPKRPLTFISEGASDIQTQKAKEEHEQNKYEHERQRRRRKTLQDQLRANAINKQKVFKKQVREKEKFNRLSKSELQFFKDADRDRQQTQKKEDNYLQSGLAEFERKKKMLERRNNKILNSTDDASAPIEGTSQHPRSLTQSLGIVKKKPKRKIHVSLKSLDDHTQ